MKRILLLIPFILLSILGIAQTGLITSYSESNINDDITLYYNSYYGLGEQFSPSSNCTLAYARFFLYNVNGTGSVYAKIFNHTGTCDVDALGTGTALATSDPINVSTLNSLGTFTSQFFTFSGANQISLVAGTCYILIVYYAGDGNTSHRVHVGGHFPNGYGSDNSAATLYRTTTWYDESQIGDDIPFYVYNTSFVLNTISLSSSVGTDNQTAISGTAITNITYATTGATGASVSGLPTGVSGSWSSNVVTISGTPSATGTFNYTVTLTGGSGTGTAIGTITVNPATSIKAVNKVPQSSYTKINSINRSSVKKINGIIN